MVEVSNLAKDIKILPNEAAFIIEVNQSEMKYKLPFINQTLPFCVNHWLNSM